MPLDSLLLRASYAPGIFIHSLYDSCSYSKGGTGPHLHFFPHIEWFLFARHLGYSDEASVIYSDEMNRYMGSKSLSNLS